MDHGLLQELLASGRDLYLGLSALLGHVGAELIVDVSLGIFTFYKFLPDALLIDSGVALCVPVHCSMGSVWLSFFLEPEQQEISPVQKKIPD